MFRSRVFALSTLVLIAIPLTSPFLLAQQRAQNPGAQSDMIEPFVKRFSASLSLSDEESNQLRAILMKHSARLVELRNRQFGDPYGPKLQSAIDDEQKAIQDEFAAVLPEQDKAKLTPASLKIIPQPPGFIAISIPPSNKRPAEPPDRLIDSPPAPGSRASSRVAPLTDDQRILQLLNRVTFGPAPGQVDEVKKMGPTAFLEQQLHPETIDDSDLQRRLDALPTTRMTAGELYQWYPQPNVAADRAKLPNPPPVFGRPYQIMVELMQQRLVRAVASRQQLQEVMTDFWFNHFNVFSQKGADMYLLPAYERDVIRPGSLGKFRDLLLAVAQSPAMLFYLDNWLSTAPDAVRPRPPAMPRPGAPQTSNPAPAAKPVQVSAPAKPAPQGQDLKPAQGQPAKPPAPPKPAPNKPGINENYARELMELHTLGVDGGYTQKDVQEVARCLTGWTIDRLNENPSFVFRPWMHDTGNKSVLGVTIPAGGGISDGLRVIDIVSRHPSTARFISKELCQRFISDDPPQKLVERVAQVFLRTDGDIKEVLRAIFASPEFNSAPVFRAKVKSPLELAASAIRAVDGDTDGGLPIQDWLRRMGEPLYGEAFPTGYGEKSERWVNTGVFLNRLNFLVALANNQIRGTSYDQSRLAALGAAGASDASASRSRSAGFSDPLTSRLEATIVHTPLSAQSRQAVTTGLDLPTGNMTAPATSPAGQKPQGAVIPAKFDASAANRRVAQTLELLLGTVEFQRR